MSSLEKRLSLKAAIVVAHGVVGWAWCALLMVGGRRLFSMDTTLIIHTIGAPVGVGLLSYFYQRRFGFTRPISTASLFLSVVVSLDVLVVGLMIERSFAMFGSVIGTWLPLALIYAASYAAGMIAMRRSTGNLMRGAT